MITQNGSNPALTLDELREVCPVIFTETASNGVSEKYTHIPTYQVIEDMEKLGWNPVDAKQVKARKGKGFQKHMVTFQHEDLFIKGEDGDSSQVQLLLINSHDGKSSFRFEAGIFRLVCSNGLILKTNDMGSFKIRHMGYTFDELQSQLNEFVANLDGVVDKMNQMVNKPVSVEDARKMAKRALDIRFGEETKTDDDLLNEIILPTRIEDEGDSLWKVFNVVQEKIVGGGFQYRNSKGKVRKARKIKNFQQDIKVNQQLWEMAEEFIG